MARRIKITAAKVRPGDIIETGPDRTLFDQYVTERVVYVVNYGEWVDIMGSAGLIGPRTGSAPDLSVYVRR